MSNTSQAPVKSFGRRKVEASQGMVDVAHVKARVLRDDGMRQTP
jgi:hypothetical protein